MKKYEELLIKIKTDKIAWKKHTVRSLAATTGYSNYTSQQALKVLRGKKDLSDLSASNGDEKSSIRIIANLSDDNIEMLLIEALNESPTSERLIRCAIDFKVKIRGGKGEEVEELDMQKLLEMGLFKKNEE